MDMSDLTCRAIVNDEGFLFYRREELRRHLRYSLGPDVEMRRDVHLAPRDLGGCGERTGLAEYLRRPIGGSRSEIRIAELHDPDRRPKRTERCRLHGRNSRVHAHGSLNDLEFCRVAGPGGI